MLFADGDTPNWLGALPPLLQWAIAIAIGASTVGIPLYAKIRRMAQDVQLGSLQVKSEEEEVKAQARVNVDEEFKRILKYRDEEIKRLTERDEAQERKIEELFKAHLECAKSEARQDERSKMNTEKIQALERKVMMLEMLLHEKGNSNVAINTASQPPVVDPPAAIVAAH